MKNNFHIGKYVIINSKYIAPCFFDFLYQLTESIYFLFDNYFSKWKVIVK